MLVCGNCGDDSGICDRCYEVDNTCGDSTHILTRFVVYKGEKQISRELTKEDRCQFCKEELGGSAFYCKYYETPVIPQLFHV